MFKYTDRRDYRFWISFLNGRLKRQEHFLTALRLKSTQFVDRESRLPVQPSLKRFVTRRNGKLITGWEYDAPGQWRHRKLFATTDSCNLARDRREGQPELFQTKSLGLD